jgi:hypothetical protein
VADLHLDLHYFGHHLEVGDKLDEDGDLRLSVLVGPADTWVALGHLPHADVVALYRHLGAVLREDPDDEGLLHSTVLRVGEALDITDAVRGVEQNATALGREGVLLALPVLRRLLDEVRPTEPRPGRARGSDPQTSHNAGRSVARRAGSQQHRLLAVYADAARDLTRGYVGSAGGLTDSEARAWARLPARSCYWKRCSELRQDGLVEVLDGITRPDVETGEARVVCRITDAGRAVLTRLGPVQ